MSGGKASVAQLGGSSDMALTPAPALGFSGAPALDGDGKFAGIALLKPVQVAGPATGVPAAQAVLVNAERCGISEGQWCDGGGRRQMRRRRWCA